MQNYQQIDAEIAQHDAEAERNAQCAKELRMRRESMAQHERDVAVPGIVNIMTTLGITLDMLRAALAAAKPAGSAIHRYINPETLDTHSGKGHCPDWLTKETKKDPQYENPAWTAKNAAADASKKKNEPSGVSAVSEAPPSNVAVTISNDAPTTTDSVERSTPNGSAPVVVANIATVDVAHAETNTPHAPTVSDLN